MIGALRRQLAVPALTSRLRALAAGAPAAAPVSLTVPLDGEAQDWLSEITTNSAFWYLARPALGLFRLGIGHALQVSTSGAQRFAALDNAFAGIAGAWRHDGRPLAFCGFAFDEHNQAPLPNALLAVPAILLESAAGHCRATLTTTAGAIDSAPACWRQMLAAIPAAPMPVRLLPSADATLANRAWQARVHAALRDIAAGRAAKIVLARQRRIDAERPIPPAALLAALVELQPESTVYAHGHGPATFLGASPERLVRLAGGQVTADAQAGTAWPGSLQLDAEKNRHEQSLVRTAILEALAGCCTAPPRAGPVEIRQAGPVVHLHSRISGQVAPGTSLFDLLRALHPTPAVGGFPVSAAQAWLAAHDERRAGWYSGGFGYLCPDGDGEFSVALRSALLSGTAVELQAGAGIVAGSNAAQELAETEAKFATLLEAIAHLAEAGRRRLG